MYGLGIPLMAAVFIAAMLWAMSRVLLAVDPSVAPWVALLFAANILVASTLASILRGRRAFVMIIAVIVVTIVAGGIAGAVVGEQPVEHVAAPGGHEGPPPPEGQPPGEPGPGPTVPGGITLVAQNTAFDTQELTLRAGKKTPILFDNRDPFPHNLGIYSEPGGEALFDGTAVAAASTTTYDVPPLDEGSYYFQCDFHPTEMNGTVKVGSGSTPWPPRSGG
jgi:plastocyanin